MSMKQKGRKGPVKFWWFIHNFFAHPLFAVFELVGMKKVADFIHDETIPLDENKNSSRKN
jgi:hypothetical protein